ncbi:MAG: hypothetical protein WC138_13130, partial [Methanoculleus sp.]
SAIGTERSRTADLFTVFWTKSAMVGYSSPARVPGNMTDNNKVDAGGYQPDFIGRLALSRSRYPVLYGDAPPGGRFISPAPDRTH